MPFETQNGISVTPGVGSPITTQVIVQDEGTNIATVDKLNIVGPDVEATYDGGTGRINITTTRSDVIRLEASRSSNNTTSIYMRGNDGLPMNVSPFYVPFNGKIVMIAVASAVYTSNWSAEVYKNTNIIPAPNSVDAIVKFDVISVRFDVDDSLLVGVSKGDQLAVFMRGTGIDHPRVDLIIKRT